jgi:hypothetical protein
MSKGDLQARPVYHQTAIRDDVVPRLLADHLIGEAV